MRRRLTDHRALCGKGELEEFSPWPEFPIDFTGKKGYNLQNLGRKSDSCSLPGAEEARLMGCDRKRRDFLRQSVCWGLGVLGLGHVAEPTGRPAARSMDRMASQVPPDDTKSLVVICQDDRVRTSEGTIDKSVLSSMLNAALQRLAGADTAHAAWRHFFKPDDVLGVKVNCLAGRGLSSHPELVDVIVQQVQSARVKEENIIIWDRLTDDLTRAGFAINVNGRGVRCYGTDAPGADYESRLTVIGSMGSRLSRILTRHCTAIINVPVLKDHSIAGVSVSLKNLFGAIDNPNKYHVNGCDPFVADVYSAKVVTAKSRFIICDALTAQYEGGPSYMPHWTWDFNGLLVGTDPVAIDQVAYQIIDEKRREKGMPALADAGREPKYIATSADAHHRLGTNDPDRIEVIHL